MPLRIGTRFILAAGLCHGRLYQASLWAITSQVQGSWLGSLW